MSVTQGRTHDESVRLGKALRKEVPRSSHGEWAPSSERPDPLNLLEAQNANRLQWLVPVRRRRNQFQSVTSIRKLRRC